MIDKFYEGKTILLAGSTGFCGKVLTEKLLYSLPQINTIFVLIRPRKGNSIEERLQSEILDSPCFNRLREHNWDVLKAKIVPIGWDLSHPSLLLSPTDETLILESVNIIFNACSTNDYSLRLDQVLQVNTITTLRLIDLAKRASHLKSFIHLSTAFTNIDRPEGWIEERPYPIDKDPKTLLKQIMSMSVDEISKKSAEILGRLMNPVIFSKSLTDLLLAEEAKSVPICIIRPTIIGAALNEPFAGWIDTILGASIYYLSVGLGINKIAVGKSNKISDQIPVDLVINSMICASVYYCHEHAPLVVHVGSSSRNPVSWGTCRKIITATWRKFPTEKAISGPGLQLAGSLPAYKTYVTLTKTIPLFFQEAFARALGNQPMLNDIEKARKIHKREELLVKALSPYAIHEWIFLTQNVQNMIKMMNESEQKRFELDPMVIDWKLYLANFVCGIKRFVLNEPIHDSLKAESMDLNWDLSAPKSFADIRWAFSKGTTVNPRSFIEMKSHIINSVRVQNKILELSSKDTKRNHQVVTKELNTHANEYASAILSDMKMPAIRLMSWALKKIWRSIYKKIVVDESALKRIKKLISTTKGSVILVPSHKSYIDFLIVTYVLFAYQIKTPFIASNERFLNLQLISKALKLAGVFFVKNKKLKDELFLSVMTEYIQQLLKDQHLVEFFIEGYRSRSGRILHPRFEMLSICASAFFEGEVSDLTFVPISINYDRVIESESFPLELVGEFKEAGSHLKLLQGLRVLNRNFGRVHITIGEPLSLVEFSKAAGSIPNDKILYQLGYELVYRLQETLVIMPTSIVAAVLLMNRKIIGEEELVSNVEWIRDEILARKHKVSEMEKGSAQVMVKNALTLLSNIIIHKKDLFNNRVSISNDYKKVLMLSYYRNSVMHIFLIEAFITCTLYSFGETLSWDEGIPLARIKEESLYIISFLKHELVIRNVENLEVLVMNSLETMKKRGILEEFNGNLKLHKSSGIASGFLCSLVWPMIDTYWSALVFCSAICKNQSILFEKLTQILQSFAENMLEERTLNFYESCSLHGIKHAVESYVKAEILVSHQTKEGRTVTLNDKYIDNDVLEEQLDHLARFRKLSMVRIIGRHNDIRRSLLAEFPKL